MLDDSLQKVIRPSRFTISKVQKAMNSSEIHSCGKSQEYRTPCRKYLNFTQNEPHYVSKSVTYDSGRNRRDNSNMSRPRDSIKDFQKKLQGMERNRQELKYKMKNLRKYS